MKIRVTYFDGPGTAVGVNMNHAMGDTASCVQFVQCWGQQMRKKQQKKQQHDNNASAAAAPCFDRSKASLSGMMSPDLADVMGIMDNVVSTAPSSTALLSTFWSSWFPKPITIVTEEDEEEFSKTADAGKGDASDYIQHEYVRLPFSPQILQTLKDLGNQSCQPKGNGESSSFVSTNDMVTAFGWMMKRQLSENWDYNISMVVNLRGRSSVKPTLFGNGITHVVATMPPCQPLAHQQHKDGRGAVMADTLCQSAKAIREALQLGLAQVPESLLLSQMGRAAAAPSNSINSFSTTSWGQFPLYQVRFARERLAGFHGHPSHPLPPGRTFSSVITPRSDGGFWYEMFVPSDMACQTRQLHAEMVEACMSKHQAQKPL